jgi:hypothetical protein
LVGSIISNKSCILTAPQGGLWRRDTFCPAKQGKVLKVIFRKMPRFTHSWRKRRPSLADRVSFAGHHSTQHG